MSAACRRCAERPRRVRAAACGAALALAAAASAGGGDAPPPLRPSTFDRAGFANPHAHIPAQCYVETAGGLQNACLFCHTDGPWRLRLGNNNPQAGANPNVGNLQASYAFGVYRYPQVPDASVNRWTNTLDPAALRAAVAAAGHDPAGWDAQAWIRSDNWRALYAQRPARTVGWDSGREHPLRLLPALDPDDLPADDDGFVRARRAEAGRWHDGRGHNTGWRALNFMPYGIFTPHAGSVSGVYLRLPPAFMRDAQGRYDLATYRANLELVERNLQDRLRPADGRHYRGGAHATAIVRGQYPVGTEFTHPLHYVDVAADGRDPRVSPYPGTRARRLKELRWMIKLRDWEADEAGLALKEESAPVAAHPTQGWIENGTGWLLGGWIEAADGRLRPQTVAELVQCVGCHSGNVRPAEVGSHPSFTSGTGNTIDSTWSLPRKLAGDAGWREMDYLGWHPGSASAAGPPARLAHAEPRNRGHRRGEFAYFLDRVVGASLYGDMPAAIERDLATRIRRARGYPEDWPSLAAAVAARDPVELRRAQRLRAELLRAFTARGEHLDARGAIRAALWVPPAADALAAVDRYRQVVVTQRYELGKDVFADTPVALRYFRLPEEAYAHADGRPYRIGEPIVDRPVDPVPGRLSFGIGITPTGIDPDGPPGPGRAAYVPDYVPLLEAPADPP